MSRSWLRSIGPFIIHSFGGHWRVHQLDTTSGSFLEKKVKAQDNSSECHQLDTINGMKIKSSDSAGTPECVTHWPLGFRPVGRGKQVTFPVCHLPVLFDLWICRVVHFHSSTAVNHLTVSRTVKWARQLSPVCAVSSDVQIEQGQKKEMSLSLWGSRSSGHSWKVASVMRWNVNKSGFYIKFNNSVVSERISFVFIPIDSSLNALSMVFWVYFDTSECLAAIYINSRYNSKNLKDLCLKFDNSLVYQRVSF